MLRAFNRSTSAQRYLLDFIFAFISTHIIEFKSMLTSQRVVSLHITPPHVPTVCDKCACAYRSLNSIHTFLCYTFEVDECVWVSDWEEADENRRNEKYLAINFCVTLQIHLVLFSYTYDSWRANDMIHTQQSFNYRSTRNIIKNERTRRFTSLYSQHVNSQKYSRSSKKHFEETG